MPHRLVKLAAQQRHGGFDVALGFQLVENLGGELIIPRLVRLSCLLDARLQARGIEDLDGLVALCLDQRVSEFLSGREAVPRLLSHGLMDDPAHHLAHRRVQVGNGRRHQVHDGVGGLLLGGKVEGAAPCQSLVENDAEGKNVRERRGWLHLQLLRGHVRERSARDGHGGGVIGHVRHAEIDDLDRVIGHHEDVAGLEIAVHQTTLVSGMQSAAGLQNDLDRALDREPLAGSADQMVQRHTRQQRHDKVGLDRALLGEFADIENLDDVWVAHGRQDAAFLAEKVQSQLVRTVAQGFQRDFALYNGVVGLINQPHAALADNIKRVIAILNLFLGRHASEMLFIIQPSRALR